MCGLVAVCLFAFLAGNNDNDEGLNASSTQSIFSR